MRPTNEISVGYRILSNFVLRGLVTTILTTNLDPCLPTALGDLQPHIRSVHEVNRTPGDYDQFGVFNKCQIVWLHGRPEYYSDKNTPSEITSIDGALISLLHPLLDGAPLIVIGYRGAEPSVMESVFGQRKDGRLDFAHGIYWCFRRGETLHPHVETLARRVGANFRPLEIADFDELMRALDAELVSQERYTPPRQGSRPVSPQAFDERLVGKAALKDLDLDLALSVLRVYCEKLKRAPVTAETLPALMREQGLLVDDGPAIRVTVAVLLLFGRKPQQFLSLFSPVLANGSATSLCGRCRQVPIVPIQGAWHGGSTTAVIRSNTGVSETLGTCASNASNETRRSWSRNGTTGSVAASIWKRNSRRRAARGAGRRHLSPRTVGRAAAGDRDDEAARRTGSTDAASSRHGSTRRMQRRCRAPVPTAAVWSR